MAYYKQGHWDITSKDVEKMAKWYDDRVGSNSPEAACDNAAYAALGKLGYTPKSDSKYLAMWSNALRTFLKLRDEQSLISEVAGGNASGAYFGEFINDAWKGRLGFGKWLRSRRKDYPCHLCFRPTRSYNQICRGCGAIYMDGLSYRERQATIEADQYGYTIHLYKSPYQARLEADKGFPDHFLEGASGTRGYRHPQPEINFTHHLLKLLVIIMGQSMLGGLPRRTLEFHPDRMKDYQPTRSIDVVATEAQADAIQLLTELFARVRSEDYSKGQKQGESWVMRLAEDGDLIDQINRRHSNE